MRSLFIFTAACLCLFMFSAVPAPCAGETVFGNADQNVFDKHDALFELYQPYLGNISGYKPVYFLFGVNPENTKYQLSVKYRFVNPDSLLTAKYEWLRGFHIAYTQTSFWDLGGASQPFDNTAYKPEFFFLSPNFFSGRKDSQSHFFLQTGYEHESNGQAGETSRSTNYLYIKPIYVFFHPESKIGFQISPKIWTYFANTDRTNPDIDEYRGYFDLQFKFGRADLAVCDTHWQWAEKGHSVSLDVSYPLDRLIRFNPQLYLHVQYVNALAESMLDYTERTEAFRIGVSIVR